MDVDFWKLRKHDDQEGFTQSIHHLHAMGELGGEGEADTGGKNGSNFLSCGAL